MKEVGDRLWQRGGMVGAVCERCFCRGFSRLRYRARLFWNQTYVSMREMCV